MNVEEQKYFELLVEDRQDTVKTLKKPSARGIWSGVVEKYTDKAHFIYELIQNADDAGATKARFILKPQGLVFIHNGTRPFTISNPRTEEEDALNHQLGDLNAITSIGQSGKPGSFFDDTPKIGKFGLGFKAVFAYTCSPRIYSANFSFKLEDYIVPVLLEKSHCKSHSNDTLFEFPFDHPRRPAKQAFEDISQKLQELTYPLLFLNNLEKISYKIEPQNQIGTYSQNISMTGEENGVKYAKLNLKQPSNEIETPNKLWLFSRGVNNGNEKLKYSIGIFTDEKDNIIPVSLPAFCFFPTKTLTNLQFIIHAPFLLTDNREGIRAGEAHNIRMIELLACLAADSLLVLRELGNKLKKSFLKDDILDIIPYDADKLEWAGRDNISFYPFYERIKAMLKKEEILPAKTGYTSSENAYWSYAANYLEVFDDTQLSILTGRENACWVFRSRGQAVVSHKDPKLSKYIGELVQGTLNDEHLINRINAGFIEAQDYNWLPSLYSFIIEIDSRSKLAQAKPIFVNQDRKASFVKDRNGDMILFLPNEDGDNGGYDVILPELYEFPETKELAQKYGVRFPSLEDEIYSKILPQYDSAGKGGINTAPHFDKFFRYYIECSAMKQKDFVRRISEYSFIHCTHLGEEKVYRSKGSALYYPTDNLKEYFSATKTILFVAAEEYLEKYADKKDFLLDFLRALGVSWHPRRLTIETSCNRIENAPRQCEGKWYDNIIEGLTNAIEQLQKSPSLAFSLNIWNELCSVIHRDCMEKKIIDVFCTEHRYFHRKRCIDSYTSPALLALKEKPWLFIDGKLVSPYDIQVKKLPNEYETETLEAKKLIDFLCFKSELLEHQDWEHLLPQDIRKKVDFVKLLEAEGISLDQETVSKIKQYVACHQHKVSILQSGKNEELSNNGIIDNDGCYSQSDDNDATNTLLHPVLRDIIKASRISNGKDSQSKVGPTQSKNGIEEDFDGFIRSSEDVGKEIEKKKSQLADEIRYLEKKQELFESVKLCEKYSFGWFKGLLELELWEDDSDNEQNKGFSISFYSVCLEDGTERTLILKQPDRNIPSNIEEMEDMPLELHFANTDAPDRKLPIEVVSIHSYTLRIKLKESSGLSGIPWRHISYATIHIVNPLFLRKELYKHFKSLNFPLDYNMKLNLPKNIQFVFGPPGTGKTTYIANMMRRLFKDASAKVPRRILVLAPTNKAADVVVKRIMCQEDNKDCSSWFVRFGSTQDDVVEHSPVFREKLVNLELLNHCIVTTTIARFSYDYFVSGDSNIPLPSIKWDYVVIDEASMIPLVEIINVIYHLSPERFIISGDPFQIEPVAGVKQWKNENIYTCVELDSFNQPITKPYRYDIVRLTTQYRSIPSIGKIFSKLTYGGILLHSRKESEQRVLLASDFDLKPLNIVKFPVSKFESIYSAKRLNDKSAYHVYSSLLAFEFLKYLNEHLEFSASDGPVSIGIIAPYRAQAALIERMVNTMKTRIGISICVGTIHSFQGDECNIIIDVFNPPPRISPSEEMFLNKQNIINVSVSRAKDYLFILMPDSKTENYQNLHLLLKLEELCLNDGNVQELTSSDLEKTLLGSTNYLENNSFATGHLMVNVYSKPEHKYEVRSEANAIDVQIVSHKDI